MSLLILEVIHKRCTIIIQRILYSDIKCVQESDRPAIFLYNQQILITFDLRLWAIILQHRAACRLGEGTVAEMAAGRRPVPCMRWADSQKYCQKSIRTCPISAWIRYWRLLNQVLTQEHYGCCYLRRWSYCRRFHWPELAYLTAVSLVLLQRPVASSYLPRPGDHLHLLSPDQLPDHS